MSAAAVARVAKKAFKRVGLVFEEWLPGKVPSWWRSEGYIRFDYASGIPYHRYRLTSGSKAEIAMLDFILMETIGKRGPSYTGFSRHITMKEFAAFACLKVRAMQDAAKRLKEAKIIQREGAASDDDFSVETTGWGWRCTLSKWDSLPSYTPPPPTVLAVEGEEDDQDEDGEKTAKPRGEVRVLGSGKIPRDKPSKPVKITESIRIRFFSNREGIEHRSQIIDEHDIEVYLIDQAAISPVPIRSKEGGNNGLAPKGTFGKLLEFSSRIAFPSTRAYIERAAKLWSQIPLEEQLAAFQMLAEHEQAGTFEHEDLKFWRIDLVVKNRMWELPIQPKKMTAKEREERDQEEVMEWARNLDRKLGRR